MSQQKHACSWGAQGTPAQKIRPPLSQKKKNIFCGVCPPHQHHWVTSIWAGPLIHHLLNAALHRAILPLKSEDLVLLLLDVALIKHLAPTSPSRAVPGNLWQHTTHCWKSSLLLCRAFPPLHTIPLLKRNKWQLLKGFQTDYITP